MKQLILFLLFAFTAFSSFSQPPSASGALPLKDTSIHAGGYRSLVNKADSLPLFWNRTRYYKQPIALVASASLNFPSVAAATTADLTVTVTGAVIGDVVQIGVPNASQQAGTSFTAWVSAANTVTVRCSNVTVGAIDPAAGTFKVFVYK